MVKGCKYLLLLVILPFIWLNQSGLDRINDQKNDRLNDQEKDQISDRLNDQKKTLVMTLPPIHQYQTENIRPVRKFVKTLLVIVGVTQSLRLGWFSSFVGAAIRRRADMGQAISAQMIRQGHMCLGS